VSAPAASRLDWLWNGVSTLPETDAGASLKPLQILAEQFSISERTLQRRLAG
jgi:hypothetical protein